MPTTFLIISISVQTLLALAAIISTIIIKRRDKGMITFFIYSVLAGIASYALMTREIFTIDTMIIFNAYFVIEFLLLAFLFHLFEKEYRYQLLMFIPYGVWCYIIQTNGDSITRTAIGGIVIFIFSIRGIYTSWRETVKPELEPKFWISIAFCFYYGLNTAMFPFWKVNTDSIPMIIHLSTNFLSNLILIWSWICFLKRYRVSKTLYLHSR